MTALEQFKAKQTQLARLGDTRQSMRRAVDAGEMAAGAFVAGALDAKLPKLVGAPPSLLVGVAMTTAGLVMKQRDATALGLGMIIPHAYAAGQSVVG